MADLSKISKLLVVAILAGGAVLMGKQFAGTGPETGRVSVTVPALSARAKAGKLLFDANCKACHGENAAGSDNGPPLVHGIYKPGHHGDQAFLLAVRLGVRAHHWRYGNMPPQDQVSAEQAAKIVTYVRQLQRANGVY